MSFGDYDDVEAVLPSNDNAVSELDYCCEWCGDEARTCACDGAYFEHSELRATHRGWSASEGGFPFFVEES